MQSRSKDTASPPPKFSTICPIIPACCRTFVWQDLDIAPKFPVLKKFLSFWERQLDGKLHSVRVDAASLIQPGEWRHTEHLRFLN